MFGTPIKLLLNSLRGVIFILIDTGGEFITPNHLSTLLDESNEGSLPCLSTRLLGKPVMHAAEIERSDREDLLQMDFRLSAVACVP